MSGAAIFGKLPAHGDFVARGLAPAERDSLDDWLSASMASARTALGDAFDGAFDVALPWRFVQADGAGWLAGAVAPSVDGVGRRFPILARMPVDTLERGGDGAARCEAAIYEAFEQGRDADGLLASLAEPPGEWHDEWPGAAGWWTIGGSPSAPLSAQGDRPPGLIEAMLTTPPHIQGADQTEGVE